MPDRDRANSNALGDHREATDGKRKVFLPLGRECRAGE